ncbi:MAG TPA: hypothetical protein PLL76_23075, partial [Thermoanaerobaculia bacterium]|nr:hypothetical protein [Thermoanaerobaculia bacterium]
FQPAASPRRSSTFNGTPPVCEVVAIAQGELSVDSELILDHALRFGVPSDSSIEKESLHRIKHHRDP